MRRLALLPWLSCLLAAPALAQQPPPDTGWTQPPTEAQPPTETQPQEKEPQDLEALRERLDSLAARVDAQEKQIEAQEAELETLRGGGTSASAELEALLHEAGAGDLSSYTAPKPLDLYGFADFGYYHIFSHQNSLVDALPATRNSFVVGNLNLFLDAHPAKNVRTLVELRFTNLPHGEEQSLVPYVRTDARVTDVTDPSGRRRVIAGSVIIERAYTHYSPMDEFQLIVGQFFTPYGIWNIDHANPTLISLMLPVSQVDQFMPDRLVGVQALGTFHLRGGVDLGYHVHVSNGRSEALLDFTTEKALGGRLFLAAPAAETPWKVGVSGYTGELNDRVKVVESLRPVVIREDFTVRGREHAVGADASLDAGPLRLRSEGVMRRTTYETGRRPPLRGNYFEPDKYSWDAYILGAYRLPWLGLEPYLWFEVVHDPTPIGDTILLPSVGLNIHFTPAVLLKTQYMHVMFADTVTDADRDPSSQNLAYLASRFVVSF